MEHGLLRASGIVIHHHHTPSRAAAVQFRRAGSFLESRGGKFLASAEELYFTIMDFKGATRLFADPEFDGDPVVIYEPAPGQPVIPPDDLTSSDEDGPPVSTGGADGGDATGGIVVLPPGGGKGRTKYFLDDVTVKVAAERSQFLDTDGKLITEDYRVHLKADIRKTLLAQFGSLGGFLRRWSGADRKQAILDEIREQGLPMEVLCQAVANGEALDIFDLVAHVAFDQRPLTRRERANKVKKRDIFGKYGDQARAVLEALLDKYADHGISDIEDHRILELPPFDRYGTKTQIRRGLFGGAGQYARAVVELENALYDDFDDKRSA